jgi:hypothetical protein
MSPEGGILAHLGYSPAHSTTERWSQDLTGDIALKFKPWPKQERFSRAAMRYKAGGGGRGGGKTALGAGEAWDLLVSYPGNVGFMGRADLEDLRRSTLKEFFAQDPGLILQHHQTQMWIDVESIDPRRPSRLYYGELKDPDSQLGVNLGFFVVDEAHEIPRRSFDNLCGNLRLMLPDGTYPPYYGLCLTNPFPGWMMDVFPVTIAQQKQQRTGDWPHANYGYFPFLAKDNPANPPEYWREILPEIYRDDPVGYQRMVLGIWDVIATGLVYPFRPYHRWKAPPGSGLRLYRHGLPVTLAIDPSGGAAPFACLVLQELGGYVCVVDMFYRTGGSEEDLIAWLQAKPYRENIADAICDPAAKSVIDRLNRLGLATRGLSRPKDIKGQINAVKGLMKQDVQTGFARLLIDENYAQPLVTEFGLYSYKQLTESEQMAGKHSPEKPEDKHNHGINALEYWTLERRPAGDGLGLARRDPDLRVASYYDILQAV